MPPLKCFKSENEPVNHGLRLKAKDVNGHGANEENDSDEDFLCKRSRYCAGPFNCAKPLLAMVKKRIDKHSEDFMKDDALSNLTLAQKHLEDASRLLGQAGTIEDLPLVLRTSLRMVGR